MMGAGDFFDLFERGVNEVRERMIRMLLGGADTLACLQDHPLVRASGGKERTTKEVEIHFDTDRMDLHRRGLALKVRREGKKWVQEIVPLTDGRPMARKGSRVWRCRVADQSLDRKKMKKAKAARRLLGRIRVGQLRPVFRVDVNRHAWRLGFPDGTRLLLAIERGDLTSEESKSHFDDLVLEYLDGDPVRLHQTGLTLAYALKPLLTCGLPVERWMMRSIPELLAIPPVKPLRVKGGANGEKGFVTIMEQLLERMRKGHCAVVQGSGSVRTQGIFALHRAASEGVPVVAGGAGDRGPVGGLPGGYPGFFHGPFRRAPRNGCPAPQSGGASKRRPRRHGSPDR
jgi:hypothetical protein